MRYLSVLLLISIVGSADARDLHVSPDVREGPWRSISGALREARPGDRVVIHAGVYRESVTVTRGGSAEAPLVIMASPGEKVVLTGADRITEWKAMAGGGYSAPWPHRIRPLGGITHHPNDDRHRLVGRFEQVFIQGYALRRVLQRDRLAPGTFFVDEDQRELLLWSEDAADPRRDGVAVEGAVRSTVLDVRADHVHISGLTIRYAANPAQHGAAKFSGSHLRVQDCIFERSNGAGASFSGQSISVVNCTFRENGQLGFGGSGCHELRLSDCVIEGNNTKNFDRQWEAGGAKITLARGVVVEGSSVLRNRGHGLWFDIGVEATTVNNCLLAHNDDAGLFYEISFGLIARDNVAAFNGLADTPESWGAQAGIAISSSQDCTVERNILLGNREGLSLREQKRTTPRIDKPREKEQPIRVEDLTVRNNLFAGNRDAHVRGWFDVDGDAHWEPRTRLRISMPGNVCATTPRDGLIHWGAGWRRHEGFATVEAAQNVLGIFDGTLALENIDFPRPSGLDLSLDSSSAARRLGAYPRGRVPGTVLAP